MWAAFVHALGKLVCGRAQERVRAVEEEAARVREEAEQSAALVGQWQEAYGNLQRQYEASQVLPRAQPADAAAVPPDITPCCR